MKLTELYQSVTNSIIKSLEEGVAPWTRPWKFARANGIMPNNGATNRPYSGINVIILWAKREEHHYSTPNWMTYRQAAGLCAQVRAGEKSTTVVFTKKLSIKDKDSEEEKTVGMLKTFNVFNEDQIDGLPVYEAEVLPPAQRDERLECFIDKTRALIRVGGNRAYYDTTCDLIAVPPKHQFRSLEQFYATNLHELSHWTGAKQRLDRDLGKRFGTQSYAAEELVAELSAAFLCAHLGIAGELRHAEYIATWITLLKEDDRAIFTAASKASQAADYLRSFSEVSHEDDRVGRQEVRVEGTPQATQGAEQGTEAIATDFV